MSRTPRLLMVGLLLGMISFSSTAASTYRCDVGGHVQYQGSPCTVGTQSVVAAAEPVNAEDRAAAEERARRDRAALSALDREHAREQDDRRKEASLAGRTRSDRNKQVQACAKLARRARDAHDAFGIAGPREQAKARLKMQHADADFAAFCKR